jgi:ubiquinone/menaquinone biosynthesis C-methylase UbiE
MSFNPRTWYQDDRVAETYDSDRFRSLPGRVYDFLEKKAISRALRILGEDAYIVDLPCGTGRITELLLEEGHRVVGIDVSPAMIKVAVARLKRFEARMEFRQGDAGELGLADSTFDCSVSARFLSHFDSKDRVRFLRTFGRISRRWVIAEISCSNAWHRFRRRVKGWLRLARPIRFPVDERQLRSDLEASGLTLVRRFHPLPIASEAVVLLLEKRVEEGQAPAATLPR